MIALLQMLLRLCAPGLNNYMQQVIAESPFPFRAGEEFSREKLLHNTEGSHAIQSEKNYCILDLLEKTQKQEGKKEKRSGKRISTSELLDCFHFMPRGKSNETKGREEMTFLFLFFSEVL